MRVLLVADTVGGVRTFARELARGLTARGVELHLALVGPSEPTGFDEAHSCQIRDLRLEWMEEPWADVAATAHWIEELCTQLQVDLVHMNTFTPVLAPSVPVLLSVHSDVLTWWRAVHGEPAPPRWERYARLVSRALERAELLTVPTRALLAELRAVYDRLPPALVIPNAVGATAAGGGRSGAERLVVSAGRLWDAGKNVELVLRAAPAIRAKVALIGASAPGRPERGRNLRWLGPLPHPEVIEWLSRAAVFAEPARYEPFGLAALEAALCGCALVLGDIPTLREVWGEAAVYVSPDDPRALADAVNALLADPARRRGAAEAAHTAASCRSAGEMAEAYLHAYERVAQTAVAA